MQRLYSINGTMDTPTEPFTYEEIADRYAATVDTKTWNAHYERPATLSLLPDLDGLNVLDAGCGSGWYAEYLLDHGATVTALDITPKMVAYTKARVGERADVREADLSKPLDLPESAFDLVVSPLTLHYMREWEPTLREFHRLLKPSGLLVFSTHHLFADFRNFNRDDYFATELLEDHWDVGLVRFYRRPLTAITEALASSGFVIERMVEARPTEEFRRLDPKRYNQLATNPGFLVVRARHRRP